MKKSLFLIPLLTILLISSSPVWAATVTNTDNDGPGSLRDAIDNAAPNEVIDFAPGVSGVINIDQRLEPNVPVDIRGPGPDVLTISGNNTAPQVLWFHIDSGTIKVSGLTITKATGDGINNGQFGDLEVDNCIITENEGNGLDLQNKVSINNTTISNNEFAGITVQGANLTLTNSSIFGNDTFTDYFFGGGIRTNSFLVHTITIDRSTISGNMSGRGGGGIDLTGNPGTTLTITNSTITGNTSETSDATNTHGGGGILVWSDTTLNLVNSTVTLNEAKGVANANQGGGGIKINGTGIVNLKNTILADNLTTGAGSTAANFDCQGDFNSQGNNFVGIGDTGPGDCEGLVNGVNNDQVGSTGSPLDPLLGTLADNGGDVLTQALLQGSPAIDTGTNTGCPATDARGTTRPLDATAKGNAICDIGGVEAGRVDLQLILDSLSNQKFQTVDPNQPVNVTATLTNPGPDFSPGTTVTGVMPSGVELLLATVGGQDCLLNSSEIQCDLGDLAIGASFPVAIQVLYSGSGIVTVEVSVNTSGENVGTSNVLSFTIDASGGDNGGGCSLSPVSPLTAKVNWILLTLLVSLWFVMRRRVRNEL